ncbi:phosphoribosylformylglycinamidine synthase subunit PurL [Acetobacter persici]|uniref:phosphoribosylformylglycinamidine synthase subunit PurL n=1 Tax=Acetobacter persici TaxID=1076596 RepID=UPI0039ED8269
MKKTVDDSLAREFGLTSEEYARVVTIMGRTPSLTELGVFSVMWSEHCSYKSSRKWLRTLPTTAPWVIHGPGENAGVVDIGQGYAAIFKMESHNHPSFIEPYQGAATGVGGILRDVFTMGARPIANLNALRFGNPETPRTRQIIDGVVRGIGGYGNCVGVPTVGGEINFHPAYDGNPLVNAMTVGLARKDRIFLSAAAGVGNPVVYVGSRTGRDGIHGATMSSAEFDENALAKRPTVQVGDPFIEKLLIEACLELMATDAIVAIQDMGAAGLTSSAVEMAGKGGVGIELDLDAVPQREPNMTAYEMMLSESQERMLMVLKPDRTEVARKIFEKWELDFAIIGHLTETGHIVVKHKGQVEADIPLDPLADQAPIYDRPAAKPVVPEPLGPVHAPVSLDAALLKMVGSPDLASRAWVWNQYDSTVGGQTVRRPGAADAAIVKIEDTSLALAITTDCTPRYCHADPKTGGAQAVAEAWRNLTATGARPLAVTDNLNFGNPEKPEIMGQFVAAIEGMGDACRALDFPVVSGNVSLYNETRQPDGSALAILPTPAIGALGVLDDVQKAVGLGMIENKAVVLIGETRGELGQSIWLREILGREDGAPPPVDLAAEKRNGDFVRQEILSGTVSACHDLSDGGLLVAAAEMVMATGIGCELESPDSGIRPEAFWFGEDQARYLVCVENAAEFCARAEQAGVPARLIGQSGGNDLILPSGVTISAARLVAAHEAFFPALMAR